MHRQKIQTRQRPLLDALDQIIAGELTVDQLKPFGSHFGVYPQKNGKIMARIRITGGEISVQNLDFLSQFAQTYAIDFFHLTSRQTIQLHGLNAQDTKTLIEETNNTELSFFGGGGDTFRNILVTSETGIHPQGGRNLMDYARALTTYVSSINKAFSLPRKIKIGIASHYDTLTARYQDLGFEEKLTSNGELLFDVYIAGGLGKNPAEGIRLIENIKPEQLNGIVLGVVEFFHANGNRENRSLARLRHLRRTLGDDEFKQQVISFIEQYQNQAPLFEIPPPTSPMNTNIIAPQKQTLSSIKNIWLRYAITPTSFNEKSHITLFVPRGNFTRSEMKKLLASLKAFQIETLRLTANQNILIPNFPNELLARFYTHFENHHPELLGETSESFIRHCIGATICKIGILNTEKYVPLIANSIDTLIANQKDENLFAFSRKWLSEIRISGCPNACSAHQNARYGFQGCKKMIDGVSTDCFKVWKRDHDAVEIVGQDINEVIVADQLPAYICNLLLQDYATS